MYWESGTQFRIRQQDLSGLTGQKDRPQQTGWTVPLSQNGWQSGGNTPRLLAHRPFKGLSRSSPVYTATNQHTISYTCTFPFLHTASSFVYNCFSSYFSRIILLYYIIFIYNDAPCYYTFIS